jgi:hypothetical protein
MDLPSERLRLAGLSTPCGYGGVYPAFNLAFTFSGKPEDTAFTQHRAAGKTTAEHDSGGKVRGAKGLGHPKLPPEDRKADLR